MQAYQITSADSAPRLTSCPVPEPGPNQVRITINTCGLNFADILTQKGKYQDIPPIPFTMGMEISGIINKIDPLVKDFAVGDRVMAFAGHGGLAEQGVFDTTRVIAIPDCMSFEHAAAFPVAYATSHMALHHRARLQPGETLLVTGAAGGVGLTAVEIGKLMGATVIAHARGADKLAVAKQAGADHLIDDNAGDLRNQIKALGGADVVYDAVGGDVFKAAFRSCNPEGRLLAIGFASGDVPQIPANHLMVKNLTAIGFYIGTYLKFRPEVMRDSLKTLIGWYIDGQLKPHISATMPLAQVAEGLELLRSRQSTGKVVITIRHCLHGHCTGTTG